MSKLLVEKYNISNKDKLLRAVEYTKLYLAADLADVWLNLGSVTKSQFENKLLLRFDEMYPKKFISDLASSVKSYETKVGDICNFLARSFASESSLDKLNVLEFVTSTLNTSLDMFCALFRATKFKNGLYIVNYSKMAKFLDKQNSN